MHAELRELTLDPVSYTHLDVYKRQEDHQLKVGPGYMELGPKAADPGRRMVKFVRVPLEEAAEPAEPGRAILL